MTMTTMGHERWATRDTNGIQRASNEEIDSLYTNFTDLILSPATSTAFHCSKFIQPGVSGVFFNPRSVLINSANYITPHTVATCFHLTTVHLLLFYTSDLLTFLASGQAGEPGAYAAIVLLPFFPLTSGLWFSIPCLICRGDPGWLLRCNWLDSAGLSDMSCTVDLPHSLIQL